MQATEALIRNVVQQVLAEVGKMPPASSGRGYAGRNGIFTDANEAVAAASEAFDALSRRTIEDRKRIISGASVGSTARRTSERSGCERRVDP